MTTNTGTHQVLVLDSYVSGEKPRPFTVKMDSENIDFSATVFLIEATYEDNDGTEIAFAGAVAWDDDSVGRVLVTFDQADLLLAAGVEHETRRLMIWVGNGFTLLATLLLKVPIDASVGTPPAI